jgi:hypothetical protein
MIQSLFSALVSLFGALLILVLIPLLLIGIAAAILLGIGSLLTRVFPVTAFEAALIVTLAAFPLVWFYGRLLNNLGYAGGEAEEEEGEEPEPPRAFERMIVVPPGRGRGRRKRNQ